MSPRSARRRPEIPDAALGPSLFRALLVLHPTAPAVITALGNASAAANDLTLRCASMPQGSFGYLLNSLDPGNVPMAGVSQGTSCLSGSVGRHDAQVMNAGTAGELEIAVEILFQ